MTMSAGSRILWAAPIFEKAIAYITELYEVNVVNIVNDVNCEINFVNEKYITNFQDTHQDNITRTLVPTSLTWTL